MPEKTEEKSHRHTHKVADFFFFLVAAVSIATDRDVVKWFTQKLRLTKTFYVAVSC